MFLGHEKLDRGREMHRVVTGHLALGRAQASRHRGVIVEPQLG